MKSTHIFKKNKEEKKLILQTRSRLNLCDEAINVIYNLCIHQIVLGMNKESRDLLLKNYFIGFLNPPTSHLHRMLLQYIVAINEFHLDFFKNDKIIKHHHYKIEPLCRQIYLEMYLHLIHHDLSIIFHEPAYISYSEIIKFKKEDTYVI